MRTAFGLAVATVGVILLAGSPVVQGQPPQDPACRTEPLTYYSKGGPIGQVFRLFRGDPRLKSVGVVGLGTGSLAAYAEPGQDWVFFELVEHLKQNAQDPKLFTFLGGAKGMVRIELGDARWRLQRSRDTFGLLVIDTFGSDAIPVHLLTREALSLYREHLAVDGILVYHISNRHLELEPVLASLAADANWVAYVRRHAPSEQEKKLGIVESQWLVMARRKEHLAPLLKTGAWRSARTRPEATMLLQSPTGAFFYALDDLVYRLDSEARREKAYSR